MADYHDQFPRSDGPPPVIPNTGAAIFKNTKEPHYTVTLDPGAMRAVWEVIEAEAKRRYPSHSMVSTEALLRGVSALRNSYWSINAKPVAKKPTGKIQPTRRVRKNAKVEQPVKAVRLVRRAQPASEAPPAKPQPLVRRLRPR